MNIEQMIKEGTIVHEAVILEKNGTYGVLALTATIDNSEIVLGRNDPRQDPQFRYSRQDTIEAARNRLEGSIRKSLASGWRVIWRGFPYGRPNN